MIAVDHLTKRYGTVAAVDGLGFEVRQPNGMAIARRAVVLAGRCGTGDERYSRTVGSRGRRGPGWPSADAGQVAGPVVVPGPGRPDVPAQRRADAPMAAAGLGVLVVYGCWSRTGRSWARMRPCSGGSITGDLRDHRAGGPLLQRLVKDPVLGAGRRGLPVTGVPRGALPRERRRGGGLGLFIGGALNLVFGVPSASTAGASG